MNITDLKLLICLKAAVLQNNYTKKSLVTIFCVSNAVDYAKKNDVLPTICQLNYGVSNNRYLH